MIKNLTYNFQSNIIYMTKGSKMTIESRKKLSESRKGFKVSKETKGKMSESAKRNWQNKEYKQKMHVSQKKRFKENSVSIETRKKMSEAQKGKKQSEEQKRKRSERMKEKFKDKNNHPMYGKKHSLETRKKMSLALKGKFGEHARNWKGGISSIGKQIRNHPKYKIFRQKVYRRDNWICQECDIRGGDLELHHIKALSLIIKENNIKTAEDINNCEELWNVDNGLTLCNDCHCETDNYRYKAVLGYQKKFISI